MKRNVCLLLSFLMFLLMASACGDSEFDKDYKDYQDTLAKKQATIEQFITKSKSENPNANFGMYLNDKLLTATTSVRIEKYVVYFGDYQLDLKDFVACEQSYMTYSIYFWK